MPDTCADFLSSVGGMTENWELKALERRVDTLEQSRERWSYLLGAVLWTLYVVALTTLIVLSATGTLHHH
jgi:hypothetical protein